MTTTAAATTVADPGVPGYRAIAALYNATMTGLVLSLVTRRGPATARDFLFRHFRRQHIEKFLPGLAKLGLDGLPPAVACAQYHFFSNALGGVKTEYYRESDRKAWVRYPPPRWIWKGTAICAIPREVNEAMLHGWHGHNGVSLGNPRLGFVCTGQTVDGDPGLEGYYFEYDRPIAESERVRFAADERMPMIDPATQPVLDTASWPEARRQRTYRSYAMEYVRSFVPVLSEQLGRGDAMAEIGRTCRLIGLQYFDELSEILPLPAADHPAAAFGQWLALLLAAQGERVEVEGGAGTARVAQSGWRLMQGVASASTADRQAAVLATGEVWSGLLAGFDRRLRLATRFGTADDAEAVIWEIA